MLFVASNLLAQSPYSQVSATPRYAPGRLIIQLRAKPLKAARERKKPLRWKDYLAFRKRLFNDLAAATGLKLNPRSLPFKNIYQTEVATLVTKNLREWQISAQRGAPREFGIAEAFTVEIEGDPFVERLRTAGGESRYRLRDHFGAPIEVKFAAPDYYYEIQATSFPAIHPNQWSMAPFQVAGDQNPWSRTLGSRSTIIAVLDTGVDLNHAAIKSGLIAGRDFIHEPSSPCAAGEDCRDEDGEPQDTIGHGTHVAGIAAAQSGNSFGIAGVCPNCSILPVRVCFSGGCALSALASGVRYAADRGAQVINMSLGGPASLPLVHDAIKYAVTKKNVVVVASAGNSNSPSPAYPAAYEEVLSVGALDRNLKRANYSNWGTTVDVLAPGSEILSSVPTSVKSSGLDVYSGTSMAGPYAAGVAALLRSLNPMLTSAEVHYHLSAQADRRGAYRPYFKTDVGVISALKALTEPFNPNVLGPEDQYQPGEYVPFSFPYFDDFTGDINSYPSSAWSVGDEYYHGPDRLNNLEGWGVLCSREESAQGTCLANSKHRIFATRARNASLNYTLSFSKSYPYDSNIDLGTTDFYFESVVRLRDKAYDGKLILNFGTVFSYPNGFDVNHETAVRLITPDRNGDQWGPFRHFPKLVTSAALLNRANQAIPDLFPRCWGNQCEYPSHEVKGASGLVDSGGEPTNSDRIYGAIVKYGVSSSGYSLYRIKDWRTANEHKTCIEPIQEIDGVRYFSQTPLCLKGPRTVPEFSDQYLPVPIFALSNGIELDYMFFDYIDGNQRPPEQPTATPTPIETGVESPIAPIVTPTTTPTPFPTTVPTIEVTRYPTATPTVTPTGTVSQTPTRTPMPTRTSTPVITKTPTPTWTPTEIPTLTPTPRADLITGRVVGGNEPIPNALVFSTDTLNGVARSDERGYFRFESTERGRDYLMQPFASGYVLPMHSVSGGVGASVLIHGESADEDRADCAELDQSEILYGIASALYQSRRIVTESVDRLHGNRLKLIARMVRHFERTVQAFPTTVWDCSYRSGCSSNSLQLRHRRLRASTRLFTIQSSSALRKSGHTSKIQSIKDMQRAIVQSIDELATSTDRCE